MRKQFRLILTNLIRILTLQSPANRQTKLFKNFCIINIISIQHINKIPYSLRVIFNSPETPLDLAKHRLINSRRRKVIRLTLDGDWSWLRDDFDLLRRDSSNLIHAWRKWSFAAGRRFACSSGLVTWWRLSRCLRPFST